MEEDTDEKRGGAKNTSTNSYVAPTSTIAPPFFKCPPTDHGFRFCGIPQNPLSVRIISPYFTGNFYLCMATTAYFLCTMWVYSVQPNICSNSQLSWVICQQDKAENKIHSVQDSDMLSYFFGKFIDDYYSACTYLHTTCILQSQIFKKYF